MQAAVNAKDANQVVAVAYSGGRDSAALLHATLMSAQASGWQVVALHVNHGLSAHAGAWERFCAEQCASWAAEGLAVRFASSRLSTRPQAGDSIEAWARRERYAALRTMAVAHGASVVLLAHHRRDQAETLLLQALRSAGVAGLAGMPRQTERDGLVWMRPWLEKPRSAIEAYVQQHQIAYVDDDSNTDERYARNRLRQRVWPALEHAFADAEPALAAAATWAQQAQDCLDELAAGDLATRIDAAGLRIDGLFELSPARRVNALRAWLRQQSGAPAPASLIERLGHELQASGSASWPINGATLHRRRGRLTFVPKASAALPDIRERETTLQLRRAGSYSLAGWGGVLRVTRVKHGGVPLAWLAQLELRERSGGEQFQAGLGRPARSLKKQFQAADLPTWQRHGPLIYSGGQLVFVPGLGIDARVIGLPGQAQVVLAWEPAQP